MVGSSDGLDYPGYAAWFFEAAPAHQASLLALYEETIPAALLPDWFAKMATTVERPIKVLVKYDQYGGVQ